MVRKRKNPVMNKKYRNEKKILVIGGSGFFGRRFLELAPHGRYEIHSTGASCYTGIQGIREYLLDVTDAVATEMLISTVAPDIVVYLAKSAGFSEDPELFASSFSSFVRVIKERSIRLIFFSTDSVFDGKKGMYTENDVLNPLGSYGRWKKRAESTIREFLPDWAIVRTSYIYGRNGDGLDKRTKEVLEAVSFGNTVRRFADAFRSFTFVDDLAAATWKLLEIDYAGILHIAGPRMSLLEFYRALVSVFAADINLVGPQLETDMTDDFPRDTSLDSSLATKALSFVPSKIGRF
ncbi:MAG: sugar nucleotide-binding protein [Candidatus Moraniibacteriota bacterium]